VRVYQFRHIRAARPVYRRAGGSDRTPSRRSPVST
jgi:hypothetical protein